MPGPKPDVSDGDVAWNECNISRVTMLHPVTCPDGRNYELEQLANHMSGKRKNVILCPFDNAPLTSVTYLRDLKSAIDKDAESLEDRYDGYKVYSKDDYLKAIKSFFENPDPDCVFQMPVKNLQQQSAQALQPAVAPAAENGEALPLVRRQPAANNGKSCTSGARARAIGLSLPPLAFLSATAVSVYFRGRLQFGEQWLVGVGEASIAIGNCSTAIYQRPSPSYYAYATTFSDFLKNLVTLGSGSGMSTLLAMGSYFYAIKAGYEFYNRNYERAVKSGFTSFLWMAIGYLVYQGALYLSLILQGNTGLSSGYDTVWKGVCSTPTNVTCMTQACNTFFQSPTLAANQRSIPSSMNSYLNAGGDFITSGLFLLLVFGTGLVLGYYAAKNEAQFQQQNADRQAPRIPQP